MDNLEVQKYVNYILNTLQLKGEYNTSTGLKNNVLIVEGITDEVFIGKIIHPDARCYAISKMIQARNAFSSTQTVTKVNCKELIIEILKRLVQSPEFFGFPKGSEKWPLFGMVDRDYDEPSQFIRIQKLFFTDTHDLETIMLSTDSDLLTRIEECNIDHESVKKALFLAYQLAQYRIAIFDEGTLDPVLINESDGTVNYQSFSNEITIHLGSLLSFINERQSSRVSAAKLNRVYHSIITKMKKYVDKEGQWKKSFSSFSIDRQDEFWMITNGHDILSAIRFICPSINAHFQNTGMYRQNRSFEFALSASYDYQCFQTTELFRKLNINDLIVTV